MQNGKKKGDRNWLSNGIIWRIDVFYLKKK